MMILNPERAELGERTLRGVVAMMVDYTAGRVIEEWGDLGPLAAFVDVPEIKQRVTVVQKLQQTDLDPPRLGSAAILRVVVAANTSDQGRVALIAQGVVVEVRHSFSRDGGERRIVLAVLGDLGTADGLQLTPADPTTVGTDL